MRYGFSLVELSIVLVILGLLTGGILAGQSLIRASELRSISTDMARYTSATYTFRDKYFALAGDMSNATSFWGKDNAACPSHSGTAQTPGTCNGWPDGLIGRPAAVSSTGEMFQYWKQLALAGLIEGNYTGLSGPISAGGTYRHAVPGTNVPASRISNVGYTLDVMDAGLVPGITWSDPPSANAFIIGGALSGTPTEGPFMRAEDAWNLDSKLDDGKPAIGLFRSFYRFSYSSGAQCSTSNTASAAEYNLSNTTLGCSLLYYLK